MTILHDRYKVMHQGKEIAVNGSMPMTKPKPLIAPYKLPQDRLNIINKLSCDLFKRMSLRNMYRDTLAHLEKAVKVEHREGYVSGAELYKSQLWLWCRELNMEIFASIKYRICLPLYIATF